MQHIVKRKGHTEPYDDRKVYASVYSSCRSVHEPAGSAELIADQVSKKLAEWIKKKSEVTSNDIRRQASTELHTLNPNASYILLHHRIIW